MTLESQSIGTKRNGSKATVVSLALGLVACVGYCGVMAFAHFAPVRSSEEKTSNSIMSFLLGIQCLLCSLSSVIAGLTAIIRTRCSLRAVLVTLLGSLPVVVTAVLLLVGDL